MFQFIGKKLFLIYPFLVYDEITIGLWTISSHYQMLPFLYFYRRTQIYF